MEEFTCRNFSWVFISSLDFPGGSDSKESACNVGRPEFDPWVGKIPWRRKWQPTLVFLPGKSHGQRNLVGYSPQGRKELDMTDFTFHFFFTFVSMEEER